MKDVKFDPDIKWDSTSLSYKFNCNITKEQIVKYI